MESIRPQALAGCQFDADYCRPSRTITYVAENETPALMRLSKHFCPETSAKWRSTLILIVKKDKQLTVAAGEGPAHQFESLIGV